MKWADSGARSSLDENREQSSRSSSPRKPKSGGQQAFQAGAMQFGWGARGKPGPCHDYLLHRDDASSFPVSVPSFKGCSAAHPQCSLRICGFKTHHDAGKPRAAVLISFGTNGALHVSNSVNSMVSVTQHHMLCFECTLVNT